MKKKKLLAISGGTRKNSSNENILKTIARLYPEALEVEIYNHIDELPFFNPDLVKNDTVVPPKVKAFYQLIEQADGVLICTPEYVFSLPGALKNALEWTVSTTIFSYKPFAFIVASASGEKAFESMDLIMKTLLQEPVDEDCRLLIKGVQGKINDQGEFSEVATSQAIKRLVNKLLLKMRETTI